MEQWEGKSEFKECVHEYAAKMKIEVKSLALRPMTTKWASCSTDGNLNFNASLLAIDKELGKYVIVHELLHFNVPNHGKLWKSLMKAYLGDYEKMELKLKEIVLSEKLSSASGRLTYRQTSKRSRLALLLHVPGRQFCWRRFARR